MFSRLCLGGGGSSSGARVNLISSPQTLQRYRTFTLRSSPAGGGGGDGVVRLRSRVMPVFHRTAPPSTPTTTQTTVDHAGTRSHYRQVVDNRRRVTTARRWWRWPARRLRTSSAGHSERRCAP